MSVNVDDTDSSIRYSGDWDEIVGSTRQWGGGTVHSTSQHGASATITFTGTRIVVYCTLFHGTGNEIANINLDGKTTTVSKPSQSQDVYNDVWFDSGEVLGIQHTLVVSNGGGPSDTPLQLDQFLIEGVVDAPSAPPPAPPSPDPTPTQALGQKTATLTQVTTALVTANLGGAVKSSSLSMSESVESESSSPSFTSSSLDSGASSIPTPTSSVITNTSLGGTTVVSIQYISTASANGSSPVANSSESGALDSASRKPIVGGIVGGIIGALFLILSLLLLFFLRRRRKKEKQHILLSDDAEKVNVRHRNLTAVTPFPVGTNTTSDQQPITVANSPKAKHSPPSAEVQDAISPASATSSIGTSLPSSPDSARRSIEKHPEFLSDTSHRFSPFADVTSTPFDTLRRNTSYPHHGLREQDQGTALPRLRHLSGDTIVAFSSGSIGVTPRDADDIGLRPPSYHQNSDE